MRVRDLIEALRAADPERIVVISNILHSPFAIVPIKEVELINIHYPTGPVHIVAGKK